MHARLVCLVLCLGGTSIAAAREEVVLVEEDTWIHGLTSSILHEGEPRVCICPTADYWIYLKFDLRGIEGEIKDAELRLNRFSGQRPEEISVYYIPDDTWSAATLSGPTRPEPRNPAPETALALGAEEDGFDSWSSPCLTALIRREATSADGIVTLMVREDPAQNLDVRHFFSREGAPSDAEAPRLVLTVEDGDAAERVSPLWRVRDVGEGTKPSFAFDGADRVHVMGMTEETEGVVWHSVADSVEGPWMPVDIATGYFYGPGDIIVDSEGTAHLAWHNHDNMDPEHATVTPDGNATIYGINSPSHNGWDNALALDSEGRLHQSSVDPNGFGAPMSLEYSVFDGSSWTYELVTESPPFMYGLATSIAISRAGKPHIAFCEANDWASPGALRYASKESDSWEITTVVGVGVVGRFPSLALDHWDRPHIAWLDIDEEDLSRALVRYGVLNNDAWEIETVDVLENVLLGFAEARKSVSLALDGNYRPHLAYGDKRVVTYAHKPFGEWQYTTVLEHEEDTYKGLVVLRLDSAENPAVTFWQPHPEKPATGLIRLASRMCESLPSAPESDVEFIRGDCNADGDYDVSDVVASLEALFLGAAAPTCFAACDGNGDGLVDVADPVSLLFHQFIQGPPPPAPHPECGVDAAIDPASCPDHEGC